MRTAEAAERGISRRRLYGQCFERATSGAYVVAGADLATRVGAVLDVLADDVLVSHWTAVALLGLPVPLRRAALPVHVLAPGAPWRATRRSDLVGHTADGPVPHMRIGTLRATAPARTWLDLARTGASVEELVVVGDAMLHRSLVPATALERDVSSGAGRRGIRTARQALPLLDGRAESAPESVLRLLVGGSGLPQPEPQLTVLDRQGRFVARVDLGWAAHKVAVEYDGRDHMAAGQWQRDLRRRERLHALGWRVIVLTHEDLVGDPTGTLHRVRAALRH